MDDIGSDLAIRAIDPLGDLVGEAVTALGPLGRHLFDGPSGGAGCHVAGNGVVVGAGQLGGGPQ